MELFSPLGREHCEYFRLVSIFMFIIFVGVLIAVAAGAFGKNKPYMWYLFTAATPLVAYYFYRLLFSVCQASLV
jgi:hypothetical protein